VGELFPFASEKSIGKTVEFKRREFDVIPLTEDEINKRKIDIAFFSAGSVVSKEFAPKFQDMGTIVIDNSSAFRMEKDVPLIVPEVNGELLDKIEVGKGAVIANPNCSTIQMMPFLELLEEMYGLKSVVVSTYQSVSGAGNKGIDELRKQTTTLFSGSDVTPSVFPQRIAFNLIPQIGPFYPDGYSEEEKKMINESRKILSLPALDIDVTTVRVPIFYGHAETVTVDLDGEADLTVIRNEIESTDGMTLMDDFETLLYPTPADAGGMDDIFIGRLRYGKGGTWQKRINAWIVADNVRKGAALNGIQIAEKIIGGEK